jgi:ketosteroid isomerase-like protein
MSEENVELVRSVSEPFAGINAAEIDWSSDEIREVLVGAYTPDVELRTLQSGLGSGVGTHYEGWDGLIHYLKEWLEPFSDYKVEWLEFIEAGACVLAPSRQWGTGRGSGVRVEIELTYLYELRDGKIALMEQYDTLEEAREAAEGRSRRPPSGSQ